MIPHNRPFISAEDKAAVMACLDSAQIGSGRQVQALEETLAARLQRPVAVVSSGLVALTLAAETLWSAGPRIALPSYSCTALLHAIRNAGLEEEIWDVDEWWQISPQCRSIVTHTFGVPGAVHPRALEDVTHALGGAWGIQPVGSMGAAAVGSFGATKLITGGAGGFVAGEADQIHEIMDRRDYDHKRVLRKRGNWCLSDINASLALSQLNRLEATISRRTEIASHYDMYSPWPRQPVPEGVKATWYRYVIRVPAARRDDVLARLLAAGIEAIVPIEGWELLHRQTNSLIRKHFSEVLAETTISLPCHPGLYDADVRWICETLARTEDLCRAA